jgi:glycosyltransferase involved in cell wall biosynthesis
VILHRLRSLGNHDPWIFVQLAALMRRIRPDIVQTWILQMDILGGLAAWATGTPWALREPSSALAYPATVKCGLRQWVGARANAILANSKGGEAYWRGIGPSPPCRVIPNGIPLESLESVPPGSFAGFGLPAGRKVILYVGRFEEGKNIEHLADALSLVAASEPVSAVLAGDGPSLPAIRQRIERLGISDRVVLPGFVSDAWAMMKRADAFAFPSAFEGLPNVVLEAMACGCPLVVSDIPAHREFLDERSALLVDPERPGEIAEALRRTIADPEGARARARAAKEKIAPWSVASVAKLYEDAYRDVLERR